MMKSIRLNWRGQDHVIPANRAFEAGAEIEEIVTLGEIGAWGQKVPFFKVARCYATLLRFAGATVTDEEVFGDIMAGLNTAGRARAKGQAVEGKQIAAMAAVNALAACLMNGAPEPDEDADAPEKPTAS